jgi:hypothetical protein
MKEIPNDKKHPVHTRCITVTTYSLGDDSILVEGELKDDRLVEIFSVTTGEKMGPGVVHELIIRLVIKGPFFSIDDVDVEMRHIPREDCLALRDSLRPLIGQNIGPTEYNSLLTLRRLPGEWTLLFSSIPAGFGGQKALLLRNFVTHSTAYCAGMMPLMIIHEYPERIMSLIKVLY